MKKTLSEGVNKDDLKDMVLPVVSIDEYEAKTGDNADVIVITFFAKEDKVAQDLKDFLEKSPYSTLDIDLSPNPDENGHYLVFIELERKQETAKAILSFVREVEHLTGTLEWKASIYRLNNTVPLSERTIKRYVRLNNNDEELIDFFVDAIVVPNIDKNFIVFSANMRLYVKEIADYKDVMNEKKVYITLHPRYDEKEVQTFLGPKFLVLSTDDNNLIIQKTGSDTAIVMERAD